MAKTLTEKRAASKPGVKDVPAFQAGADGLPLIRGGTTSGRPGQIVRFWNRWRENYNALTALTIARVRSLNEMTQRGDHALPQWTYRTIERRHPVLKALIESCESPIENYDWDVKCKTELPAGYTEAQAEAQREALKAAYAQIDNLREAIVHIVHADFPGYAVIQKHRASEGPADGGVTHLECLHSFCICRDGLFGSWFWNPDSRQLTLPEHVLTEKNRIGGEVLPREDFIIREVSRPIDEIALENFVRRKLTEKNWDAFGEIFGLPSGVLIMPAGIPPEKVEEYEAAAREIAEGGTGAAPNGSEWESNTPPHDGSALFKTRIAQLDEDLVLAATGGKLTMLVQQGGSSQRGSSGVQENVFEEIAEARAGRVGQTFREDFDRDFLAENFPGQPVLAEFCLVAKDNVDVGEICANAATLKTAGKNLNTEWLEDQTGYTFAEDDVAADPNGTAPADENPGEDDSDPVLRRQKAYLKFKRDFEATSIKNRGGDGNWITVNGQHILIGDGESKEQAIARHFDKKEGSQKAGKKAKIGAKHEGRTAGGNSGDGGGNESHSGQSTRDALGRSREESRQAGHDLVGENAHAQAALTALHEHGGTAVGHDPARKLAEGAEHLVELNHAGDRVIKHTKPGAFGVAFGGVQAPFGHYADLRAATPHEYLQRIEESNRVFGDDARVEGTSKVGASVGLVTSQRYIHGEHPAQEEIDSLLSSKGFRKVGADQLGSDYISDKTWFHPQSGHIVADTKPDNFKKDAQGHIVPVDVIVQRTEPGTPLRKAMEAGIKLRNRQSQSPGSASAALREDIAPLLALVEVIGDQPALLQRLLDQQPQIAAAFRNSMALRQYLTPELEKHFTEGVTGK